MTKKIRESSIIAFLFGNIGLFSAAKEELPGVKTIDVTVQAPLPPLEVKYPAKRSPSNSSRKSQSQRKSPSSRGLSAEELMNSIIQGTENATIEGSLRVGEENPEQNDDDKAKVIGCMCMRKTGK